MREGRTLASEMNKATAFPARTVAEYAEAIAAHTPVPGGGSVVGVVGALAAALGEMVCQFTAGKKFASEHESDLVAALNELRSIRARLLQSAVDDEDAYEIYSVAVGLPKQTESEKQERRAALDRALYGAAAVPLSVAETCIRMLEALAPVANFGNRALLSDAAVASLLAEAALRGAVVNVTVNARLMKNGRGDELIETAKKLEQTGRSKAAVLLNAIDSR